MDDTSPEFYNWYNAAERAGTLDRAVMFYYRDDPHLYRPQVNGQEIPLPVLTSDDWAKTDITLNRLRGNHSETTYSDFDQKTIEKHVARVAHGRGDANPSIDDYLFNGDSIRPTSITTDPFRINTQDSDYFTNLTTDYHLSTELASGLWSAGLSPNPDDDDLLRTVETLPLPTREQYGRTFNSVLDALPERGAPFGVDTLLVFNTGDSYKFLIGKRADSLIVYPGSWLVTPAGGIQLITDNLDFEANVLKEYGEEVFGADEHTNEAFSTPGVEALQDLRENGDAHLDFTGIRISGLRLGVGLSNVLFIDSPEYFNQFIRGRDLTNSEVSEAELISLDDEARLEELLEPGNFVRPGLFILLEGLSHLQSEYGVESALSIE